MVDCVETSIAKETLEKIPMEMEDSEITPALMEKEQNAQFNSFRAFRQEEEY